MELKESGGGIPDGRTVRFRRFQSIVVFTPDTRLNDRKRSLFRDDGASCCRPVFKFYNRRIRSKTDRSSDSDAVRSERVFRHVSWTDTANAGNTCSSRTKL